MIKALKKKYALSDQGAKDLLKGIVYSVLANISLMFPVILLAIVLNQLLAPVLGASAPEISAAVYTVIGIVILAVVFIFHYCQYTATYLGTYDAVSYTHLFLATGVSEQQVQVQTQYYTDPKYVLLSLAVTAIPVSYTHLIRVTVSMSITTVSAAVSPTSTG